MKILSLITSYRISISKHIELPLFTIILETIYSLYVYIFESKTSTKIARGRILVGGWFTFIINGLKSTCTSIGWLQTFHILT